MSYSQTEENYLKAIYKLSELETNGVSTKSIGDLLEIKSPTVSDMLKKLSDKNLIKYARYKGVSLTKEGEIVSLKIVRKHRLWETFLVEKFNFKWDEVHDIAEQLEHIDSPELVNRLEQFLESPRFDPHGDPIPDRNGNILIQYDKTLDQVTLGKEVIVVGVKDHSPEFLKYLESLKLNLGVQLTVLKIIDFDQSIIVKIGAKADKSLSHQVCKNLVVKDKN